MDFGLSDKEAQAYLAVLRMGKASALDIAKECKFKRTSVYLIAERLLEKEILGINKAKYGTYYFAVSPRSLLARLNRTREEFSESLPDLEAIERKSSDQPQARYYQGREGYFEILEDSLDGYNFEILYLGSTDDMHKVISDKYTRDAYIPERIKRNIAFRQIVMRDQFAQELESVDKAHLRLTKYLPLTDKIMANKLIYKNKVAYFTSDQEMSTMLIESAEIADMERKIFNLMWNNI